MAATDAILVLNAGSSSLKFSLFAERADDLALVCKGQVEGLRATPHFVAQDQTVAGAAAVERTWPAGDPLGHEGALGHVLEWLKETYGARHRLAAVGHRVAHGGKDHLAPTRVDAALIAQLETLVALAPLHVPHNLAPMRTVLARLPALPQVACFDTAMHRTLPRLEQMFALPQELEDEGVRRYGLHGLSYEHIANVLPSFDQRAARGRTVVLHLGSGASMCALQAGRSVATTMSFTSLDGLPMGTRTGALDPGVMLYLMNTRGMDARAIEELVYTKSGLLGVSGVSSDLRVLQASKEPRAALAVNLFIYRIGRELGALAATLGGLDALVFTAGIGEHDADVRARVCRQAAWLGVELDAAANATHGPRISATSSRATAWVIPTNEELVIARHTRALLARQ